MLLIQFMSFKGTFHEGKGVAILGEAIRWVGTLGWGEAHLSFNFKFVFLLVDLVGVGRVFLESNPVRFLIQFPANFGQLTVAFYDTRKKEF